MNLDLSFMLTVLYCPIGQNKMDLRSIKVDFQAEMHPHGLNMLTARYNLL
jgi:hypothetical protein